MVFTRDGAKIRGVEIHGRRWDVILTEPLVLIAPAVDPDASEREVWEAWAASLSARSWFIEHQGQFDLEGFL